ncbi:TPA: 3'-5' exoribonuclease, partial [Escherichia coli]|nr:3'-5' exoribonuclease [Escherichia coli]HEL8736492.1 3'-5' exoribonuclease [Escherichia coli]HEL9997580.1 3'-5' exoribonuclease [Escherichia coli]HEM0058852.1 3'-5' exoribonuclease [Escherichia coli]HEM0073238.1 3'-5' exoribonuclease [Escherichia coli]
MSTDKEQIALYYEAKNGKVRKRLGINAGFYWRTEKKLSVAISRCVVAMDEAGYDEDDFKKPVRVHFPVVDDLPPEGVFDTEFCNRYEKGGEDGITMVYVRSDDNSSNEAVAATGDDADDQSNSFSEDAAKPESCDGDDHCHECEISIATLGLTHRFLHLYFFGREFDGKYLHHATPEQRNTVIRMEMDMEDGNLQSMLTAVRSHPELDKLNNYHLCRLAESVGKAFTYTADRRISPAVFDKFISTWMKTDYLDQGLLTKEWHKGNCVSGITRTPSGANAGGGNLTDRGEGFVHDQASLARDVATGVLARSMDLDIYNLHPAHAKRVEEIIAENKPPFSVFRDKFITMPGGLDYSRAIVVASVKEAPIGMEATPHRVTEYLNKVLTETDHANPDPEIVDIACGRSSAPMPQRVTEEEKQDGEEKPQPSDAMADEQATTEAMEPDTTEHRQDTQSLDTQVKVTADEVNKIMQAANINQPDADKLLAASRGEFVDGISDPNDPKWVKGIETRDSVNQNQQETEQPEPVVQQEVEKVCTACGHSGGGNCPDCGAVMGDTTYQETFDEENRIEAQENAPEKMEGTENPRKENAGGDQDHASDNETGETTNASIKVNSHQFSKSTSRIWQHMMVDLETMGKNPDAPIISIGAIFFDPQNGDTGPEFSKTIDLETAGGVIDRDTIKWWLKRSREAQSAILTDEIPLDDALLQLREFIDENSGEFFVRVWGNGANFDNVILRRSYERQEIPCPWRYTNDRDVRTIVQLGEAVG